MNTWFICTIRYKKITERGFIKKVSEKYLVDSISFTEAEARIIEEVSPFISGEFTVSDIKRAHYSELFPSEEEAADKWYDCKLEFIKSDEKSGAEKKTKTTVLVQAADLRDAMRKLDEGMKGTMADYNAVCIKETAIMDVYPYEVKEDSSEFSNDNSPASKQSDPLKNAARKFVDNIPEGTKVTISTSISPDKVIIDKTKEGSDDIRRVEEDVSTEEDAEASI